MNAPRVSGSAGMKADMVYGLMMGKGNGEEEWLLGNSEGVLFWLMRRFFFLSGRGVGGCWRSFAVCGCTRSTYDMHRKAS